jgi:hypothetical protein
MQLGPRSALQGTVVHDHQGECREIFPLVLDGRAATANRMTGRGHWNPEEIRDCGERQSPAKKIAV